MKNRNPNTETLKLPIIHLHSCSEYVRSTAWLVSNTIFLFADCAAGYSKYIDHVQYDTCMPCPRGTYRARSNSLCTPCPDGTTTMGTGTTSIHGCNGKSSENIKMKILNENAVSLLITKRQNLFKGRFGCKLIEWLQTLFKV